MKLYLLYKKNGELHDNENVYTENNLELTEKFLEMSEKDKISEKIKSTDILFNAIEDVITYFDKINKKLDSDKKYDKPISANMAKFLAVLNVAVTIKDGKLLFATGNDVYEHDFNEIKGILYRNIAKEYKTLCHKDSIKFKDLYMWKELTFENTEQEFLPRTMRTNDTKNNKE